MAQEQLLRKAAIERLSSPEQLDTLMRVTSPMGWVALLSVGALIVGVVIWGFVGSLSVRVDGQGILLRGESVHAVEVASGGTLAKLEVNKGDVVSAGQIIARLSLPDVENQIVTARAQLAEMQSLETSQGGDMSQLQANLRAQVGRLQHQRELKKQMVDKGLATQQSLLSIDQQISGIQSSLLQSQMGSGDRGSRSRTNASISSRWRPSWPRIPGGRLAGQWSRFSRGRPGSALATNSSASKRPRRQ